jgi:paired amphipathic helix protein Sin3a
MAGTKKRGRPPKQQKEKTPDPTPPKTPEQSQGEREASAESSGLSLLSSPSSVPVFDDDELANETPSTKRAKTHHAKPPMADGIAVSPTLVPQPPQPLPPLPPNVSTEDFQFFDRVKKFIGNKNSYAEFLKLCNMYVNELLDKNPFYERASSFINGNPDLMAYFERMIHHEGDKRDVFVPKARPSSGRINLAHCRGLGPSYRLLPKRERLKVCSGRDDLCRQVLNDEWASHPTWASEDSGFVAHRKNQYEENMHRIEEERHDYDFNIEACLRTIQLIEPIVLNLKHMTQEERDAYVLHPGLGGQSETIYQRVVKKIYDRERGQKVLDDMFARPAAVLPIVLQRLKQKAEEWKVGQVRLNLFLLFGLS